MSVKIGLGQQLPYNFYCEINVKINFQPGTRVSPQFPKIAPYAP